MWRAILRLPKKLSNHPVVSNDRRAADFVGTAANSVVKNQQHRFYYKKCCCWNGFSNGEKRKDQKAKYNDSFHYLKHDWLDVVSWSGVLLLSWYICQPFRKIRNPAERYALQRLENCSTQYQNLVSCIANFIVDPPVRNILPSVSAVKSSSSTSTKDNAIKEGCEKLEEAHEKVLSGLANFLGTECMQAGKYEEAFYHFSEAATKNNTSAFFNLGICYEMGFGTSQSFQKAAEFYKKASDMGHATAMYNLGVFHVHGWGGVAEDADEAKQLFVTAARLGQADAKRALSISGDEEEAEEVVNIPLDLEVSEDELRLPIRELPEPQSNDLTDLWFKVLNIKLDSTDCKEERNISSDSGVNDLSPTADVYETLSMSP